MIRTAVQRHPAEDRVLREFFAGRCRVVAVPVSEGNNVQCACCAESAHCANTLPSALTGMLLDPEELLERVGPLTGGNGRIEEFCIAGPGEALVSPATRVVLRLLAWHHPSVGRSVWTNGLLLADQLDDLVRLGLDRVYVTINAATGEVAERLYSRLSYRGRSYAGSKAAELLLEKQWLGLSCAAERGIRAFVHSVLLPSVNEADLGRIAGRAARLGADGMVLTSPEVASPAVPENSSLVAALRAKRRELAASLPQQELLV